VAKAGAEVLYHYLDDFIVLGPPSSKQCAEHQLILQQVCKQLGVPPGPREARMSQHLLNILRHYHRYSSSRIEATSGEAGQAAKHD